LLTSIEDYHYSQGEGNAVIFEKRPDQDATANQPDKQAQEVSTGFHTGQRLTGKTGQATDAQHRD
jgi:hypothetical protein